MAEPTNNQPSPPPEVVEKSPEGEEKEDPYPRDHKICTIITMVLCGLILNIFAFACLIPAYYFSSQVSAAATRDTTCELFISVFL